MSWINEDLPADWPSRVPERPHDDMDAAFTTSRSSDSIVAPTVAIQTQVKDTVPQWKEAIKPREEHVEMPRLTGIFDFSNIKQDQGPLQQLAVMDDTSDFSTESPSLQSSSEHEGAPRGPISRRLKVFGQPDTYTNERLGNLLSSMGANSSGTTGGTSLPGGTTQPPRNSTATHSTGSGTVNESDIDLANNLQNEGRRVLQGLAPYRPDLSAVMESSLDELEQQLTSQGTTPVPGMQNDTSASALLPNAMDTTTSDSGARTLDSLHSNMSNWDTMGGTHARDFRLLRKRSSKTLCGSDRKRPEEELSALAINEPLPSHSHEPHLKKSQAAYATTSEQPLTSDADLDHDQSRQSLYTSQPQRSLPYLQSKVAGLESTSNSRRTSSHYEAAFDVTPAPHLTSERRHSRSPLVSRLASRRDDLGAHRSGHQSYEPRPLSQSLSNHRSFQNILPESQRVSEANQTVETSIAAADVSFSVAYERLARILRERVSASDVSASNLSDIDSLDLNNCELEAMVGLDKFTPHLTTLFINGNSIRSLEGLPPSVVHLDLSLNMISPVNTFPASFISTLILSGNQLEDLRPLENLRALCSLDVSDNKLTSLRGVRSLTALRTLNVSGNQLHELDLSLGMLVELDASQNQVRAVRLDTPLLESLDLEGNNVVTLNEPMPNLRILNIRGNNATVDFRGWSSLESVLFDGNKALRNLEAVAGNLSTFSWEQPIGGSERSLKHDATVLSSVRDLKLGGIERGWQFGLDSTLVYATQHLDLAHSGIRELPPNLPEIFPFLTSLNLAFNKLDDRAVEILRSCTKLERLSVLGNRMTLRGQPLAARLPRIRVLDSRSQRKRPQYLEDGLYVSDIYGELMEEDESTVVTVNSKTLQWLDGHWTKFSGKSKGKHTTRPGFQSPLYPISWEERQAEDRLHRIDATTMDGTSLGGATSATDFLKALYVHHWQRLHGPLAAQ